MARLREMEIYISQLGISTQLEATQLYTLPSALSRSLSQPAHHHTKSIEICALFIFMEMATLERPISRPNCCI